MRICKKCILPDNFKNTTFNEEGICNYCQSNITISKKLIFQKSLKKKKVLKLRGSFLNRREKRSMIVWLVLVGEKIVHIFCGN